MSGHKCSEQDCYRLPYIIDDVMYVMYCWFTITFDKLYDVWSLETVIILTHRCGGLCIMSLSQIPRRCFCQELAKSDDI